MDATHRPGFAETPMTFAGTDPAPAPVLTPVLDPVLAEGSRFRVRFHRLAPGEATSLHAHLHRSENWIVVEGTARIILGSHGCLLGEGEAMFIPLGQPHRLENPGRLPVTLIAVETGCYLGEDDLIRHEVPPVEPPQW